MSVRDREVLELLRDEPELLAIADGVAETEAPRHLRPIRALLAVATVAVALFALVLASPWDRGGGDGSVLGRALAAIPAGGPVVHLTARLDSPGAESITSESYYEPSRHLLRVVTRDEGQVVSDFTTRATEDEFTTFPGFLDQAAFYRTALRQGRAKAGRRGHMARPSRLLGAAREGRRPAAADRARPEQLPADRVPRRQPRRHARRLPAGRARSRLRVARRGCVRHRRSRARAGNRARRELSTDAGSHRRVPHGKHLLEGGDRVGPLRDRRHVHASGRPGQCSRRRLPRLPPERPERTTTSCSDRSRAPCATGAGPRPPRSGSSSTRRAASGATPPARRLPGRARRPPVGPRSAAKRRRRPPQGHTGARARATRAR